jgi:endonuclease/exonuclease/phosphatase (EEP) superfamily protein YafD
VRLDRPSLGQLLAIVVAVPWAAWALVRLFGLDLRHPIVAAMAFTPYVAATAPVPVVVALALRRWVVAGVAAVAALALAAAVLPRAMDGPQAAPADARGPRLVVMTANLYEGRADARAVTRLVDEHHVDVLSLQELTPEAVTRLDRAGVRRRLPGRVIDARWGAAGSGLMARTALRPTGAPDLSGAAQPEAVLTGAAQREAAAVGGHALPELHVKAAHPHPPISSASEPEWRGELRDLPGPRSGGVLRILAGDFNGTLDHREIRRLLGRGYTDAADATGDGLRATWPVGRSRPGITIDHILVPPTIRVRRVTIHEVTGSDHRAVIAELVLPR